MRQAVGDMDVAWSRARLDEKYLIHGFRKFTLGDRYLPEGLLPLWAFVRPKAPFAMSHAIHKIVSIKRCQSYFISRRSPHLSISKDSESCASAHRCLHYAYARLIARVTFQLISRHSRFGRLPIPLDSSILKSNISSYATIRRGTWIKQKWGLLSENSGRLWD